jgi:hypothetical protein
MDVDEILSQIDIVPVDTLKTHEQTIAPNVARLHEAMLNMGRLVDPLIIDREHHIVLDGNHRKEVLELLKCQNAACQVVNYMDPGITLGGWFPITMDTPEEVGLEDGHSVDFEAGVSALESMSACFMSVKLVKGKKECRLYECDGASFDEYVVHQENIIKKLEKRNMVFIEDNRADLFLEKGYTVFYRRLFKKEEVVKRALAGQPFPAKSTRHMIPNRIIRLNLHLGLLNEDIVMAKASMEKMLRRRITDGNIRRYTEPVIVLY